MHELGAALGRDDAQPVWLFVVGRELGDELAVTDPGRCGQPRFLANAAADVLGDRPRSAETQAVLGDVEIGFVEAQWLDQIGISGENPAHLL